MSVSSTQESAESQIFIIIRHADEDRKARGSLSEKGKARALIAAAAISEIAKNRGQSEVRLVASPIARSQETAAILKTALKVESCVEVVEGIRERDQTTLSKAERKTCEVHQKYKSLKDPKERFYADCAPGAEKGVDQYARMKEAVSTDLETHQGPLNVFVGHQTAMRSLFQGLTYNGQLDGPAEGFLKKSHNCEIFVLEKKGERFTAIERRAISTAKL
jgi:broad specificity phosphatase PhoE